MLALGPSDTAERREWLNSGNAPLLQVYRSGSSSHLASGMPYLSPGEIVRSGRWDSSSIGPG